MVPIDTDLSSKPPALSRLANANYGGLWLLVCILASIPIFWSGFVSLGDAWMTPEYSHGPLIPVLSAYMFLRELRKVPPPAEPVTDRGIGLMVTVFALSVAVFGNLARIPDIITYAFIIWVAGMILLSFGFKRGILFWTGVLHLVYMLPLPNFLYWQLTIWLQLVSSELGVWFVRAAGVSVFLEGNVIDLGVYKLQVAEACSGLRYLFPILSFSYLFCVLYKGPVWHKIVLLLAAAPITVFMNAFRIGVIGVLVNSYGIEHAEGFLHYFEGWVIFLACVAILFLMAVLMQRLQRNPQPIRDTLDIDFDGLGEQVARIYDIKLSRMLMVATGIVAMVSVLWMAYPRPEATKVSRDSYAFFPLTLNEWQASTSLLDTAVEATLGADDYISATFKAPGEASSVGFFSAFYDDQTDGSGIHSPEVCLPVGGWEMFDLNANHIVDLEAETGWAPFPVNRAIIQKGLSQQLIYYWFEQRGRQMTNDFNAKIATIYDSLMIGRQDGAIVRFTTPMQPGETPAEADARIQRLMVHVLPELRSFIPGGPAEN